ncbi:MAG: sugar ABC transporter permease [Spirochaetales bacterium]|nr:sugar ABC transporter permease [Spirochaetales bacterium]
MNKAQALSPLGKRFKKSFAFYFFMLPGIIYFALFHYFPIFNMYIAFKEFNLAGEGDWIGIANFVEMFSSSKFYQVVGNTLILSGFNILLQMSVVIVISLLLNEIRFRLFKRTIQTIIYLPHFLSWVVVASVFHLILSPQTGIVNVLIQIFGGKPIYFLGKEEWWRPVYLFILLWREIGWGTVIYLAALSGIDPQLYEAANIDGANRFTQMRVITIPHLIPTMVAVLIWNLSKVLNLFHSVLVLYSPAVYDVSDVIETYVFRKGIQDGSYGYATAVGIFKAIIAFILVISANKIVKKLRGEAII